MLRDAIKHLRDPGVWLELFSITAFIWMLFVLSVVSRGK